MKAMKIGCSALLAAGLLTGCVPHDIQPSARLQLDGPAAGTAIEHASRGDWPHADWWKAYGDPQLDALLVRALADNPRLAIAADRIRAAQAAAGVIKSATQPALRFEAASIHTHFSENEIFPPPLGGGDFWDNSAQLALSYELDIWGRDEQNLKAALAAVEIGSYEQRVAQLALTGAIVRSYVELALRFELKDNQLAILDDQRRTLDIAQRRFAAGIGTELETQEIAVEIAATRAELQQLDLQIATLRESLGALSGGGPVAGAAIARPALRLDAVATLPSAIPADLIGRRPDVVAERWRVERAADLVGVAKARFYPNINLRAFAGMVSFGFSKFFDASSANVGAGPALSVPLFDGGNLRAGLDAQTAVFDAAVHSYNATVLDALSDVSTQLVALDGLQRVRSERAAALAAATRAHELAQQAFRAGLTDSLNVLHTQTALSGQRNALAAIDSQRLAHWAALNQALGGGLLDAGDAEFPRNAMIERSDP